MKCLLLSTTFTVSPSDNVTTILSSVVNVVLITSSLPSSLTLTATVPLVTLSTGISTLVSSGKSTVIVVASSLSSVNSTGGIGNETFLLFSYCRKGKKNSSPGSLTSMFNHL